MLMIIVVYGQKCAKRLTRLAGSGAPDGKTFTLNIHDFADSFYGVDEVNEKQAGHDGRPA